MSIQNIERNIIINMNKIIINYYRAHFQQAVLALMLGVPIVLLHTVLRAARGGAVNG